MGRKRKTNKHLPTRMYFKGRSYYFVSRDNKWINLGRDYQAAVAQWAQLTDTTGPLRTMSDLFDRYERDIMPTKAPVTVMSYSLWLKMLRAGLGKFLPDQITKQIIYKYTDKRGKTAPVQSNRELAVLSDVFKYAIRWGVLENNPVRGVMRYPETPRDRYVTDEEMAAFCDFAGPFWAAWCRFKLLTGLRQGDMLALRLSALKDDGIHVTPSKTGKPMVIEWSDASKGPRTS